MKKILLLLSVAAMWGCTDYVSQWDDKYEAAFAGGISVQEQLPAEGQVCVEGTTTSLADGDCITNFVCNNNAWVPQSSACNNVQQQKICDEGATTSVVEGSCTSNFVCSNNAWVIIGQPVCTTPIVPSSSSKKVQSSSSKKVTTTSSASKNAVLNETTYTEVTGTVRCSKAMFCAASYDNRVETGKDDGSDTYGYWFAYDDASNGGSSYFSWPYGDEEDLGYGYIMSFAQLSVMQAGEIVGSATIDGNDEPSAGYLGLGFNVGGEKLRGYDISSWNGLCIIYKANAYMGLEIHPANEATVTKYDNPVATLYKPTKTTSAYIVNIPWSEFEQGGWGKSVAISTVTKSTAVISFKFTNNTSFSIYAIGKYGTCN